MRRIGQPLNDRSRRTRAAILDAAWALLEQQPSQQVTMEAVAERAGVTRRAIYLHFASRGALLRALHEYVDEVLDLESSVQPVREARGALATLDEFAAHLARYHPRILAIDRAVDRGRHGDADLTRLWKVGLRAWRQGCREIATRLADEGRLAPPWTVEAAADMLLALMSDEVLERLTVDRRWSARRYGQMLKVLLRRTFVLEA